MSDNRSNPIRVAIVSDSLPPVGNGGIGTSHGNLMLALSAAGFNCRGFTYQEWGAQSTEGVVRYGIPRLAYRILNVMLRVGFRCFDLRVKEDRKFGMVSEASVAILGSFTGLFLQGKINKFSPDVIIVPDRGAISAWWPGKLKRKTLFVSHSNPLRFLNNPLIGYRSELDARLAFWMEERALTGSLAAICPSGYMRDELIKSYSYSGNVFVVPNTVNDSSNNTVESTNLLQKYGIENGTPVVYIPAAGNHNKGRQFVFEIVRRLARDFESKIGFYLSGPLPPELLRCLEAVAKNAILICPGNISYQSNLSLVGLSSICVSPTLIESFGMALLEAQALGLPVVTFNVGGTGEVVLDGVTGFCKPLLDIDGLITESLRLLRTPQLREQMSIAAKERVEKEFSSKKVAQDFTNILRGLAVVS